VDFSVISWPCLHQWLETRPSRQMCPVCKSAINRDKVIPLYGRNGDTKDPRDSIPPRPRGQRSEPTSRVYCELKHQNECWLKFGHVSKPFSSFNLTGVGDTVSQVSLGIGAFPFSIFFSHVNFGDQRPAARILIVFMWIGRFLHCFYQFFKAMPGSYQYEAEVKLNRIFLVAGLLVFVWLLLAWLIIFIWAIFCVLNTHNIMVEVTAVLMYVSFYLIYLWLTWIFIE